MLKKDPVVSSSYRYFNKGDNVSYNGSAYTIVNYEVNRRGEILYKLDDLSDNITQKDLLKYNSSPNVYFNINQLTYRSGDEKEPIKIGDYIMHVTEDNYRQNFENNEDVFMIKNIVIRERFDESIRSCGCYIELFNKDKLINYIYIQKINMDNLRGQIDKYKVKETPITDKTIQDIKISIKQKVEDDIKADKKAANEARMIREQEEQEEQEKQEKQKAIQSYKGMSWIERKLRKNPAKTGGKSRKSHHRLKRQRLRTRRRHTHRLRQRNR